MQLGHPIETPGKFMIERIGPRSSVTTRAMHYAPRRSLMLGFCP
jgi:hypothetical protein